MIIIGLIAFLAGLGIAKKGIVIPPITALPILAVGILSYGKSRAFAAVPVIAFGLVMGIWRGSVYLAQVNNYKPLFGRKVTIIGTADLDAIYDKSQLAFDVTGIRVKSPKDINLPGKISIKGFGEPMVYRGDTLKISGKLYKTRGSRQAGISFASIEVVSKSGSFIYSLRRKFEAGMQNALPEPLASFGLGLLIGQRNTLPDKITLALAAVGLTHIVAVSGYNLTIIIRAVRRVLKKSSKYQTSAISAALIIIFLLFTGFSPSIVRAAIVSGLSLLAWYYGRSFRPVLLILLAAAITAAWYPIYLWSDVGWYLSFLAFYGVLILAPLSARRIYKRTARPHPMMMIVYETMAAQIMTLPLIMYIFGQLSVVALIANVLVIPFVPLAMLLSLVAGLAGMLLSPVAGWIAWPARIILTYMLDAVELFSRIPHALSQQGLLAWQMLALYGLVVLLCLTLWRRTKDKDGIITDNDGIKT